VENPGAWLALVQEKEKTCERLMRKTNPPAALVQNDGDKPGGDRCAELTAGSEIGARRDIPSIVVDMEGVRDALPWEAGTDLGNSDPTVIIGRSDRGALI
jgi:hypothetical protein